MSPADRTQSEGDDVAARARELAGFNGAAVLAAALIVRLRADGRPALADAVTKALAVASEDDGIIIAGPPNPHRPGA